MFVPDSFGEFSVSHQSGRGFLLLGGFHDAICVLANDTCLLQTQRRTIGEAWITTGEEDVPD